MRMCTRPRNRTGGESDGSTVITAISAPRRFRFATVRLGGGTMLPSVLMSASLSSSSWVIGSPLGSPVWSRAPIKMTPARR